MSSPELDQVRKLMQVAKLPVIELQTEGLKVSLRRD
jgi:oxaloacetate decarboxylase alpha subunit